MIDIGPIVAAARDRGLWTLLCETADWGAVIAGLALVGLGVWAAWPPAWKTLREQFRR